MKTYYDQNNIKRTVDHIHELGPSDCLTVCELQEYLKDKPGDSVVMLKKRTGETVWVNGAYYDDQYDLVIWADDEDS